MGQLIDCLLTFSGLGKKHLSVTELDMDDPNGVLSTLNSGTTTPVASPVGDIYQYYQGTSMATPHVTGIASLMLSQNQTLTSSQILSVIQDTARAFPTGTGSITGDCNTSLCGAGIIDAAAAVEHVVTPIAPLYAGFGASGLWKYDGTTWTRIATANPSTMFYRAATSTLYVGFAGAGLWQWYSNAWRRLATSDPANMVAGF